MPLIQSAEEPTISREQLRDFHVAGRGLAEATPAAPLRPSALRGVRLPSVDSVYPMYVQLPDTPRPLGTMMGHVLGLDDVEAAVRAFRNAIGDQPFAAMDKTKRTALDRLRSLGTLRADRVAALSNALPETGWVVPFSQDTLPVLHACAVASSRAKARGNFHARVRHYRDQLHDLLTASAQDTSPEAIVSSLAETEYFDADVLADALKRPLPGHRLMEPERRSRILDVLAILEKAVREADREPAFWIFDSRTDAPDLQPLGGRIRHSVNSFSGALLFQEEQLGVFSTLVRALRTARLEIAGAFNAGVHGPALDRLDWQGADTDELKAVPPVVIVDTATHLADSSLTDFGRLLRSGLPVHILVADCVADAEELTAFLPDYGYIAMAHREPYVLQSSLARPDHLIPGLEELAQLLRPAVAVVSGPGSSLDPQLAWQEASALQLSNAAPLYSYNPQAGDSWSERFKLGSSPVNGASAEPLTFAHAVALSADFLNHFRVLPRSAWNDEQIDLESYLRNYKDEPPLAIPYISIEVNGATERAVITRQLANLCRDRMRAMRVFEELAGIGNAYVEAAVAKTREEVQRFDTERENEAKLKAASQAVQRVVAMLTNTQPVEPVSGAISSPVVGAGKLDTGTAAAAIQDTVEDPYIESSMCTSCNDCTKINPRLFVYNADKQAYISDPRAGSYAELVKAAEGCPAKCIHPGSPRPDDRTATPALRARGAKLA